MNAHGIKAATILTGLSAHVIRVWEKRYAAVTPQRTETNRRLYTDDDISRLQTLSKLTKKGYTIGHIATLQDAELEGLFDTIAASDTDPQVTAVAGQVSHLIQATASAIRNFDQATLDRIFDEASLTLGYSGLLELVVIPVIQQVGEDWHNGSLTSAGEHAATSFIMQYLTNSVRSFTTEDSAPVLVVTTPAGQLHELGAFIGSCQARRSGWKIVYLGPSLPADEIAHAVNRTNASALLLSIVYPIDDPRISTELKRLRDKSPKDLPILVGGSGILSYRQSLQDIDAVSITSISGLAPELLKIRQTRL
ncbi:MAG: MerR family transcriptional regulator [Akkermansiaceae bacterium]|jgi:DNA-binding transcriptional MerR regulator/methylmalonyl-CoA mutase cobalamin-binding subunit|tara:strand:- start:49980 stop:50903 length:924 start_codon:yes stop_codon:yes gene_type:complete